MTFVFALLLLGKVGSITSHRSKAYSWNSPIGDFKQLMMDDLALLDELETQLMAESLRVHVLMEIVEEVRKSHKLMLVHYVTERTSLTSDLFIERYRAQSSLNLVSNFTLNDTFWGSIKDKLQAFPDDDDIFSVLDALVDLQKFYGLNASDLAEGHILWENPATPISASSCIAIAYKVCKRGNLHLCQDWVEAAIERVKSVGDKETDVALLKNFASVQKDKSDFNVLCANAVSGYDVNSKAAGKGSKCSMWTNHGHPWLLLQPVGMERIAQSPDVVVFHNVISDKDIEHLKQLAKTKLGTATTLNAEESFQVDSVRVAHNCWLSVTDSSVIRKLDILISAITGLELLSSSEDLQVANYGIAGHYNPHTDWFPYAPGREITESNRKATFMFYLSDVEIGGATVFVYPGVAVKPVKGSAVFWHNLLPSGEPDTRTVHGSCPVLLGDKWVANRWIWETNEELCKPIEYIGRIH